MKRFCLLSTRKVISIAVVHKGTVEPR